MKSSAIPLIHRSRVPGRVTRPRSTRRLRARSAWFAILALPLLTAAVPGIARSDQIQREPTVALGSDYFQTQPGAFFNFGPPIGTINFQGLPVGPGNTDTIVQRKADATINGAAVPLQITLLSLESTAPVNIGGSFFDVFVTLDPASLASDTGSIMFHGSLAGGTFDSSLDVSFDARFVGATSFDIFGSVALTQSGASWSPTPAAGTELVTGPDDTSAVAGSAADQNANLHTGLDPMEVDFFAGTTVECAPDGHGCHPVNPSSSVPEPDTLALFGAAVIAGAWFRRRRPRR